ncbi:MAG: PTS sugar transporter subunit IIA [Ignavibacteria bacterium]|nr:PTS sugar transporter subunit IIA [Ignavibacteria bacterium]
MISLLDALQEGRLIELPENDKFQSLRLLAHILEAIPSVPSDTDVAGLVLAREQNMITAIGKGFACPHARVGYDEELICAVGWSPNGIEYGAPDGQPVHIVVMYLVPDNQRNQYLKEISLLAKALQNTGNIEPLKKATDLNDVRNFLLDLASASKGIAGFESRARMIQLEVMSTAKAAEQQPRFSDVMIEPLTIIAGLNQKSIILTQNPDLVTLFDNSQQLTDSIAAKGVYEQAGWRVISRSSSNYQANRFLYDCIAVKLISPSKK